MIHYTALYDIIYVSYHGANRDVWLALAKLGLKQFMLCMMVVWNTPHGPDDSESWLNTLQDCLRHLKNNFTPADVPIWQAESVHIAEALEQAGVELPGGEMRSWSCSGIVLSPPLKPEGQPSAMLHVSRAASTLVRRTWIIGTWTSASGL